MALDMNALASKMEKVYKAKKRDDVGVGTGEDIVALS